MARNDRILLDGIVDERIGKAIPSDKRDEAFEYLALEQVLKDFDLSHEELLHGWIDGARDGGIDGFYIVVNGHLLRDLESFPWPKTGTELRVFVISCKHHDTFKQATVDSLIASITELFNFEIEDKDLRGAYSDSLLLMRSNLRFAYRKLSLRLQAFSVDVCYVSRGDTSIVGEEVESRASQLQLLVKELFGVCTSNFSFVGSTELIELLRRVPNYTLELPFVEALSKGERYVVLAKLSDYFAYVSDKGKLRRYLFESNVRDFMGFNRVNEDIKATLEGVSPTDFWWLNNGVTILATSARIIGKCIQATDIQIVNGLQTTESIFRHFGSKPDSNDDRCVLIKVIVSQDEAVRDSIIRATNNQTAVELASLHATDKIQRDIEDVLLRHGMFYERRKNFYLNQGHPAAEIITPLYLAAGYIALLKKRPYNAVGLRSKFMRSVEAYEEVFSESVAIEVWPKIASLLKRVDVELEKLRPQGRSTDKYLKSWRYICAFLIASKACRTLNFDEKQLIGLDVDRAVDDEFLEVWKFLGRYDVEGRAFLGWTSVIRFLTATRDFAGATEIQGLEAIQRTQTGASHFKKPSDNQPDISEEFINSVRAIMPAQPWKPGLHKLICDQLNCSTSSYFSAVSYLIQEGVFHRQRDGVLYDLDGNVISFDPDRVDPETLSLL